MDQSSSFGQEAMGLTTSIEPAPSVVQAPAPVLQVDTPVMSPDVSGAQEISFPGSPDISGGFSSSFQGAGSSVPSTSGITSYTASDVASAANQSIAYIGGISGPLTPASVGVAAASKPITPDSISRALLQINPDAASNPGFVEDVSNYVNKLGASADPQDQKMATAIEIGNKYQAESAYHSLDPNAKLMMSVNGAPPVPADDANMSTLLNQVQNGQFSGNANNVIFSRASVSSTSPLSSIYNHPAESLMLLTMLGSLGLQYSSQQFQKQQYNKQMDQYNKLYDVNGDGVVNYSDTLMSLQQQSDISVSAFSKEATAQAEAGKYKGPPAKAVKVKAVG